jgi:hypothetical protein
MTRPKGPLGIDPLQFSIALFGLLMLFVVYLLLPRAVRKQYFGAYPRRHAWSARSRMRRTTRGFGGVRNAEFVVALFVVEAMLSCVPVRLVQFSLSSVQNFYSTCARIHWLSILWRDHLRVRRQ